MSSCWKLDSNRWMEFVCAEWVWWSRKRVSDNKNQSLWIDVEVVVVVVVINLLSLSSLHASMPKLYVDSNRWWWRLVSASDTYSQCINMQIKTQTINFLFIFGQSKLNKQAEKLTLLKIARLFDSSSLISYQSQVIVGRDSFFSCCYCLVHSIIIFWC